MKTRNGFVSNSSSASYIVRIHDMKVHDFCKAIAEEFQYNYFDITELIERFKERGQYKYLVERLEELKHPEFLHGYYYDKPDAELITDLLNQYYRIQTKYYNGDIILTGSSSMHNSISDMPEILKDFCTYFMFESKKILECKVEHD